MWHTFLAPQGVVKLDLSPSHFGKSDIDTAGGDDVRESNGTIRTNATAAVPASRRRDLCGIWRSSPVGGGAVKIVNIAAMCSACGNCASQHAYWMTKLQKRAFSAYEHKHWILMRAERAGALPGHARSALAGHRTRGAR